MFYYKSRDDPGPGGACVLKPRESAGGAHGGRSKDGGAGVSAFCSQRSALREAAAATRAATAVRWRVSAAAAEAGAMAELEHLGGKRAESARMRRAEQLRRWRGSLTEQESAERRAGRQPQTRCGSPRVRFEDGAVFLAACSSGDTDEVKKLLARGADINTVNVDGLTALHQVTLRVLRASGLPQRCPRPLRASPGGSLSLPSPPARALVPLGWSDSLSASFLRQPSPLPSPGSPPKAIVSPRRPVSVCISLHPLGLS